MLFETSKMIKNSPGLGWGEEFGEFGELELSQARHAAKSPQEFLRRPFADSRNVKKCRAQAGVGPALAVKSDGETVRFIANLLDEVEDW